MNQLRKFSGVQRMRGATFSPRFTAQRSSRLQTAINRSLSHRYNLVARPSPSLTPSSSLMKRSLRPMPQKSRMNSSALHTRKVLTDQGSRRYYSGQINLIGPKQGSSSGNSTSNEIYQAMDYANRGFEVLRNSSKQQISKLLGSIGDSIQNHKQSIVSAVQEEAFYPLPRVETEFARTVNHFKMFSQLTHENSFVEAKISNPKNAEGRPDLRKMLFPLGPVVVFGASNFPLAYSVAGGDTVSALAAGCPVVVKVHPAHPKTSWYVARAMQEGIEKAGFPLDIFSMLHGDEALGAALVKHDSTAAVGFTGSIRAGRILFNLAASRESPIPVYAEMGAVNPVVLLDDALSRPNLAQDLVNSFTLSSGQFCTNPGLVLLVNSDASVRNNFVQQVTQLAAQVPSNNLLTQGIAASFSKGLDSLSGICETALRTPDGEGQKRGPAVMTATADQFVKNATLLQEEVFGPSTLLVHCDSVQAAETVLSSVQGQLTGSLHFNGTPSTGAKSLLSALQARAGRVIYNGFPTGVDVCLAQNHTGPYPASSCPQFTAVGPDAAKRWMRPVSFQNVPDAMLPLELQDANPLKIWRSVDGKLTNSGL